MKANADREKEFLAITGRYGDVIAKVCYLYTSPNSPFEDLYQESLINIWQGMESFRSQSSMSTWIYRVTLNTCITWHRRNGRHSGPDRVRLEDMICEPADTSNPVVLIEELRELHRLISMLGPIDKALITLWLDEKSYDEISHIMGMTPSNVAVRLHRAKERLSAIASHKA